VKRLGIAIDTFKRGKRADSESMFRAYTDEERVALLDKLRYSYGRFVGAVAEGRKLSKDAVDAVGRGHVYSGDQAMPLHLVDRFGGIGDALEEVRKRIGVPAGSRLEIGELPKVGGSVLGYVGQLLSKDQPELPLSELPVLKDLVRGVPASVLLEPEQAQMRLPYELVLDN
jgi:protease-4